MWLVFVQSRAHLSFLYRAQYVSHLLAFAELLSYCVRHCSYCCTFTVHICIAHGWYILPMGGTYCPWVVHIAHGWYILPMGGTYCPWVVHIAHGWYILPMGGTYCPWVVHIAHGWYILPMSGTYCQWVVLFSLYHHVLLSVRLYLHILLTYNLFTIQPIHAFHIMYYTHARLLYVKPFSSLADSLVSLTPDSVVLLLLPRPYLLVCACNCMYIRTYVCT